RSTFTAESRAASRATATLARLLAAIKLHRKIGPTVGGGEIPRIDGDVAGYGPSSFCGGAAVVLATVKDARRRFAVAFGHP
ncbi:MAG TPA: hypothetical protein VIY30_10460, partial [Burkholderiaceae bacterium]